MVHEFPEGQRKLLQVNGRSIGIFHLNGNLHAVLNYCPHQGAPLCEGLVMPWITSTLPGEFLYEKEGGIVRCPWHQWEFDITTGCLVVDEKVRTKTYEVTIETFDVSVDEGKVYLKI
ncbi:Rieske (2Fe-2S) protein [Paenibacillus agricola]|nr:Rieske (2Fe-2S) protein [Paenibacillus agricola]